MYFYVLNLLCSLLLSCPDNADFICTSPSSASAVAQQNKAFTDYYDYLEVVLDDSAELTASKSLFDSLEDELERNVY